MMRVDKVCAKIAHAPPPQQGGLVATILAILDRFWLTVDTLKSEQFNAKKLNTNSLKWLNQEQFLAISPEKLSKEQIRSLGQQQLSYWLEADKLTTNAKHVHALAFQQLLMLNRLQTDGLTQDQIHSFSHKQLLALIIYALDTPHQETLRTKLTEAIAACKPEDWEDLWKLTNTYTDTLGKQRQLTVQAFLMDHAPSGVSFSRHVPPPSPRTPSIDPQRKELIVNHIASLLLKIDTQDTESPYYNQAATFLNDQKLSLEVIEDIERCVRQKLLENDTIPPPQRSLLIYLFALEMTSHHMTAVYVKLAPEMYSTHTLIHAPKDGNCMLWSLVLARQIRKQANAKNFENFGPQHLQFNALKVKQQKLRKKMVKHFKQQIADSKPPYRRYFLSYLFFSEDFTSIIPKSEQEQSDLLCSTEIPDDLLNKYIKIISSDRSWNGDFEAAIIADFWNTPILILDEHLNYRTTVGRQFLDTAAPLVLRHSGNHYDALC